MTWSLSPTYWIQRLKSINEMTSFLIEIMFGTSWWICMDMDVDAWLTLWARALISAFSQCLLCPSSLSPGHCSTLPGTNSVMLRSWINIKIIKIIKSWKVWRVAFRQVVRIGESAKVWWKYSSWIFFGWSHWGIAEAISFMSCMYLPFEMFRTSAQSLFRCLFSQSFLQLLKVIYDIPPCFLDSWSRKACQGNAMWVRRNLKIFSRTTSCQRLWKDVSLLRG